MAKSYTYPHWKTSVIDHSIYIPLVREDLPLFRPIFFMRAEKGVAGVPVWTPTYNDAIDEFGEGTFDLTTKFFSREALYLQRCFARAGAFIVRMVPEDAEYASMILELQVKKASVPQYQRDSKGLYILDPVTGERLPMLDATGAIIKEPGYELKWSKRAMILNGDRPETFDNLRPTTYGTGDAQYTVYPILAVKAKSVGSALNNMGVKLFVDLDELDDTLADMVDSLPYTLGVVNQTYGQDTVSPVYDIFQNQYLDFVAKPNQMDTRFERLVSFDDITANQFTDEATLPFEMKLFHENMAEIGALIQAVEPTDTTIVDPYLVNLTEPWNIENVPMPHVMLHADSIYLNDSRILYFEGGADGSIDDASIEALTRQYLKDGIYPELIDQPRYPFNFMIDTGVSLETKRAMIQFMGEHDAFKLILTTQDCNLGRYNTKAEDLSIGQALYGSCLLQPESIEKGTEVCRAEIYQHAGKLANSVYTGVIGFNLDVIEKKSKFQSTSTITGQAAGLPNSEITIFKEWNWMPCDADHKQRSWDSGLNYAQYFDMTGIHWPAMRTVYRYDTSVLSSALFTDVVVHTKHLARYNWSRYVGLELPFNVLAARAGESLSNDIGAMLGGLYQHKVSYAQTAEEAKIGYISHANIDLYGHAQNRITKFYINCYRTGYTAEEV